MMLARKTAVGQPSDDPAEHRARRERKAFQVVATAIQALADTPLHDEFGLARARREYVQAKGWWAAALADLDRNKG